ncbi:MAG: NAD(P)-dependent dehydrogenase (short-subunit alcohol dehydrogenase family) [Porticoccaceae bacterium]|jgi:NAD(P)-dependent dehydrogenase (short-subunit alcohol dehydrogenase family)
MSNQLLDKVAIITGGASGIGKATAELFIQEGAKVVIADVQQEKGEQVARALGDYAAFLHTDVSDANSVEALVKFTVKHFGGLHIMFNNAGVTGSEGGHVFCDNDFLNFQKVMAVDLLGPMLGSKFAARHMSQHGGGSIITTASIAGSCAGYGVPEYRAAKAAIVELSKSMATEFAEYNVRVNTVSPGAIPTDIFADAAASKGIPPAMVEKVIEASMEVLLDWQSLKRAGRTSDIAEAVLFLASDRSTFITGIDLVVDGGASLPDKVNRAVLVDQRVGEILSQG